jgi:hypothetical protein
VGLNAPTPDRFTIEKKIMLSLTAVFAVVGGLVGSLDCVDHETAPRKPLANVQSAQR